MHRGGSRDCGAAGAFRSAVKKAPAVRPRLRPVAPCCALVARDGARETRIRLLGPTSALLFPQRKGCAPNGREYETFHAGRRKGPGP